MLFQVKGMGMESPQLLLLVENCPKGAETFITRVIHILTDKGMKRHSSHHGLSQQGIWVPFWTPKPIKRTPQDTQFSGGGISKNLNLKLIIEFFHLQTIPMTLFNDIMPYFDEFTHVYGWNMSILWYPLKIWTPQNFTAANFRHPVSKSWLRHCISS